MCENEKHGHKQTFKFTQTQYWKINFQMTKQNASPFNIVRNDLNLPYTTNEI